MRPWRPARTQGIFLELLFFNYTSILTRLKFNCGSILARLIYDEAIVSMMYIQRDIEEKFLKFAERYPVVALVGPRQAGKTTMLKHLMKKYNSSYILFDDPDARRLFDEDIKKFMVQYMEGYDLAVLDEIQYCRDAGSKLKYLADTGHKIWVTSSSEILLSKDVLSFLVGRVGILRLYPFSIHEFMRAKGYRTVDEIIYKRIVWEHALYGGFPQVVLEDSVEMKKEYLRNLHETMIMRDVARAFSIDDIGAVERLSRYIAINSGAIFSYTNASNAIGISYQTVRKYLDALVKSQIAVEVPPFFTNRGKEISKQPKVYFLDTGLRNSVAGFYPVDMNGGIFENYVLSELVKMGFRPRYWRTKAKAEVDFVVEKDGNVIPIEVKLRATTEEIERGFRSFIDKYSPESAVVISYAGEKGERKIKDTNVVFVDIWGLWSLLT